MSADDAKKGTTATEAAKDPDALRAEIAEIRAELGDTVEALAAKADVKAQAQAKVQQTKDQLRDKAVAAKEQVSSKAVQAKEQVTTKAVQAKEQAGQTAGTLKAKTADPDARPKLIAVAGAVVAVIVAVVGGRAIRARRTTSRTDRVLRKVGRR